MGRPTGISPNPGAWLEFLAHCHEEEVEPPTPGRVTRIVRSALYAAEETWTLRICARLSPETTARICSLAGGADADAADAAEDASGSEE